MRESLSVQIRAVVALIVVCAAVFVIWRGTEPREYRGLLRYSVIAVGFETTGVALVTPDGTYELALPRGVRWRDDLHSLNGRRVVVTGRLTIRKGKWRPKRHVIIVEDFRVEPQGESQQKRQRFQSVVVP